MSRFCAISVIVGFFLLHQVAGVQGQDVFIDKIEVISKYNATYLTSYSSVYLYNIKYVNRDQIRHVVRELEASKLYNRVEWELVKQKDNLSNRLILKPSYPRDYESFVLDDIVLDRLAGVDEKKFRQMLGSKGISFGTAWYLYSYTDLVSKINSALAESVLDDSARKEIESPWISIRCFRPHRVSLVVHGSSFDHLSIFDKPTG